MSDQAQTALLPAFTDCLEKASFVVARVKKDLGAEGLAPASTDEYADLESARTVVLVGLEHVRLRVVESRDGARSGRSVGVVRDFEPTTRPTRSTAPRPASRSL